MNAKQNKVLMAYWKVIVVCAFSWTLRNVCAAGEPEKTHAKKKDNLFMVAAVFKDGGILPIGFCDHGNWSNHWGRTSINSEKEYEKYGELFKSLKTLDQIPDSWFKPLSSLPKKFQYLLLDGKVGTVDVRKIIVEDTTIDGGDFCLSANLLGKTWGIAVNTDGKRIFVPSCNALDGSVESVELSKDLINSFNRLEEEQIPLLQKKENEWEYEHRNDKHYEQNFR